MNTQERQMGRNIRQDLRKCQRWEGMRWSSLHLTEAQAAVCPQVRAPGPPRRAVHSLCIFIIPSPRWYNNCTKGFQTRRREPPHAEAPFEAVQEACGQPGGLRPFPTRSHALRAWVCVSFQIKDVRVNHKTILPSSSAQIGLFR